MATTETDGIGTRPVTLQGIAVEEFLTRSRLLAEPLIREQVARLGHPLNTIAGYHLGYNDPAGTPVQGSGGKGVAIALALCAAGPHGNRLDTIVSAGVAVELLHVFSHLHDDVMDGDTTRRHRPTAWTIWGEPMAILTGDALIAAAYRAVPPAGVTLFTRALADMCDGQALDLSFEKRTLTGPRAVTVDDYLAMAAGKTGALYAAACGLGATAAGSDRVEELHTVGLNLGLIAQIVDDLNGLVGNPHSIGKPVGSDLRSAKKTLPLLNALSTAGAKRGELVGLLERGCSGDGDVEHATRLITETGAIAVATSCADQLLEKVHSTLDRIPMPTSFRDQWNTIAHYVRNRDN